MELQLSRQKRQMNEDQALASILEKTGLKKDQLEPAHTEKMWSWERTESSEAKNEFRVPCKDVENENMAVRMAMEHFDTIENNINIEYADDDYIFSKIRG